MTRAALLRDVVGFGIAVFAAATALAAGRPSPDPTLAMLIAVPAIAAWIAWQDAADFTIPDGAVAGLALIGFSHRMLAGIALGVPPVDGLMLVAFDALLAGGAFWAIRELHFRRRGFDGLGFGDVKLAAAGAVLVGATAFAFALLAASLAGLGLAVLRRDAGGPDGRARVPFGAVLAPALALGFLAAATGYGPGPLG